MRSVSVTGNIYYGQSITITFENKNRLDLFFYPL